MSGFGGGRKAVMPGISGYASIQGNHLLCLNETVGAGLNPDSDLGLLAGNAMHEDMAEATALLNPAFLLNAVFTPEGAFAGFFAGHWYKAWEAGTELVKGIYGIPLAAPSELVIASAGGFPKDINLYQSAKTIVNAAAAVKDGGVVICVLECRDIAEPPEFSDWFKYQDMLEFEHALRRRFTIPGYIAFRCTDIARRNTLIIVTKPENAAFVRQAGMLFAADVTEAYAMAKQRLGQDDFSVTIMRNGANTVPILTLE
jgi:nickel-dependent lactate racemase